MAKQRTDYEINARQAVSEMKKLSSALNKYNDRVKELSRLSNLQNKANEKALDSTRKFSRALNTSTTNVKKQVDQVKKLSSAFNQLATATLKQQLAAKGTKGASTVGANEKQVAALNQAYKKLISITQDVSSVSRTKNRILNAQTVAHRTNTRATKQANSVYLENLKVVNLISTALRVFVVTAFHRAFIRIGQALLQAIEASAEFDLRIREIRTISDRAAVSTERWKEQLRGLSDEFGVPAIEAAEAAYQALSNQVVEAGNTQAFLREQVRLSVIAVSTLDESVQATTAIINAWGLQSTRTREINNLLFATVERGRLRLSDLGNTIGRVSILSAELGASVKEQSAALAILTRRGVSAEQAITLLRAIELKLIKPTDDLREVFDKWGVSTGAAAVQTFGLIGTINKLFIEASKGGNVLDELGSQLNRVRALIGGVGIANADTAKELNLLQEATKNASKAFDDSLKGIGRRFRIQQQILKNFVERVTDNLLRIGVETAESFGGVDKLLSSVGSKIRVIAELYVSYKVAVLSASAAQLTFNNTLTLAIRKFGVFRGSIIAAQIALKNFRFSLIGLAAGGFAFLSLKLFEARQEVKNFQRDLAFAKLESEQLAKSLQDKRFESFTDRIIDAYTALSESTTSAFQKLRNFVAQSRILNNQLKEDFEKNFTAIAKSIDKNITGANVRDAISAIKSQIREIDQALNNNDAFDRNLNNRVRSVFGGLFGVNPEEQLRRINELRVNLNRDALTEINRDNKDSADKIFTESQRVYDELIRRLQERLRDASNPQEIKRRVSRFIPDPLSRRGFRRQTRTEVVGVRRQDTTPILREINRLEEERRNLVQQRNEAEQRYNDRQRARRQELQRELETRERAFTDLQSLIEQINNLDITRRGVGGEFSRLRGQVLGAAEAAGFDPEARLRLFTDLEKQRTNIQKAETQRRLELEVRAQEQAVNQTQEAFQKAQEKQRNATELTLEATKQAFITLQSNLENVSTAFEKLISYDDPEGLKTARNDLARLQQEFLQLQVAQEKGILDVPKIEEAIKKFGTLQNQIRTLLSAGGEFRNASFLLGTKSVITSEEADLKPQVNQLTTLVDTLRTLRQEYLKLEQTNKEVGNLGKAADLLLDRTKSLPELSDVYRRNTQSTSTAYQTIERSVDNIISKTRQLIELQGRQRFNFGGTPRGFNFGGTADGIPSLLRDGEIVLTRQASQRLASVLNNSESNFSPNSNNFNFGDINLTVPEGSTQTQVEAIADQLQRRIRMGLLQI